ncbi:MAG: methyltransferase domain-containing protein [Holdemanella sp.]|nr:methyltransferase domain-containing protein [Holdemanella sp.]
MLVCPKCKCELKKENQSFKCIHNHTFDIAKQGYVNLSMKQKKNTGDNALMVKARSAFLEKDYYDFMRQYVKSKIEDFHIDICIDAGCGQGYYTKEFATVVKHAYGIDLSKEAILYASKKDKNSLYIVGSLFDMPFLNNTIDCITSIFVPLGEKEIYRCLKQDGYWIVVQPGPDHLWQLKEFLYEIPYKNEEVEKEKEGFHLVSQNCISNILFVDDVWSLLEMTPYRYKTKLEALERLKKSEGFDVTFEFVVSIWKKA